MGEKSFWGKYKFYLIGLVAIVIVAMMLIPAKIGIPGRSMEYYHQHDGSIAEVKLIEKVDDDTAIFEVSSSPCNFHIETTISLGDDIETGVQGYVADIYELAFDGSYEYEYSFYLPRDGNLLQKILVMFGISDFNYSTSGHIEGQIDYLYANEELGFSADFPVLPEDVASSIGETENGAYTVDFQGVAGSRFTNILCFDVPHKPNFETEIKQSDELKDALFTPILRTQLENYSNQENLDLVFDFSDRQEWAAAKTITPITSSGKTFWYYAAATYRDGTMYYVVGARESEEAAKKAEASFQLLTSTQGDGLPSEPSASQVPSEPQIPEGAIDWTEAGQHVGEVATVYGTVAGATYASTSTGQPTFIDVGASYPDTSRVSLAIWGQYRGNFPEPPEDMYLGKTICVTGEVYIYSGACNIEVQTPDQVQVIG